MSGENEDTDVLTPVTDEVLLAEVIDLAMNTPFSVPEVHLPRLERLDEIGNEADAALASLIERLAAAEASACSCSCASTVERAREILRAADGRTQQPIDLNYIAMLKDDWEDLWRVLVTVPALASSPPGGLNQDLGGGV